VNPNDRWPFPQPQQSSWGYWPTNTWTPRPKPKSQRLLAFMLIVGFGALTLAPMFFAWRATQVDPDGIPARIEKALPCKRECRVTRIAFSTSSATFTATAVDQDNPELRFTYSIDSSNEAEVVTHEGVGRDYWFDYRAVDWKQIPRLINQMNREALKGHEVRSVSIGLCESDRIPSDEVSPCVRMEVLTKRGTLAREYDAKTGELVSSS
jgi:hypothetical protein